MEDRHIRCHEEFGIPLGTVFKSTGMTPDGKRSADRSYAYVGRCMTIAGYSMVFVPVGDMIVRLEYRVAYASTLLKKFPDVAQYRKP